MTKVELIDGWKNAYRFYSFWASVIIAVMPDLLNLAISHEIIKAEEIPQWFSYTLKVSTFGWMAARLIKQEGLRQQAGQLPPTETK